MRQARANDHWRRMLDPSRKRTLRLKSLTYMDAKGIGTGSVELHSALTVICGSNGAGKSTLLSVCALTYAFDAADDRSKAKFAALSSWLELSMHGKTESAFSIELDRGTHKKPTALDFELHRLDVAEEWFKIKELADRETNWQELLDQAAYKDLNDSDLNCLQYLTGKPYTSCEVYEIEDFENVMAGRFPYCVVTCNGTTYSMNEMGAGEGALFLIWWKLGQIRGAGILLLEEPETHITARSQRALMDLIAERCSKELCCIITTHSPAVIEYVPHECRRLLIRYQNEVTVMDCPDERQLQMAVGVVVDPDVIAIVEDRCARIVVDEILRSFQHDISSRVYVAKGDGESEVANILRDFPRNCPGPKLIGIFDGDMKDKYGTSPSATVYIPANFKHPVEYLPWTVAPDMFLRDFCASRPNAVALSLKVPNSKMVTILSSIQGVDHHDWCSDLAWHVSKTYEETVIALLQVALTDSTQRKQCEDFATRIAELVSQICQGLD